MWSTVHGANARTQIGVQSALGTAASTMKDLAIRGPALPLKDLTRTMLERKEQKRYRRQITAPVKGLKAGAPVELMVEGKRVLARLDDTATPVAYSHASALSHQILLRAGLGAELTPAAGSVLDSGVGTISATNIPVTAGDGANFTVGQVVIINGHPRRVTAKPTTNELTIFPALPTAPSNGDAVLNAYQYFPGEVDTALLTVRHCPVEYGAGTELQQQALGVHGGLELSFAVNEVVGYAYKGQCLDWTEPGDLSVTLGTVADDMGAPLVWDPVIYLQSAGTAPSVVQISEMKVSVPRRWQRVPGPGTQGVAVVVEVAAHDSPLTVELAGHMGTAEWTAFAAGTARWMMAYCQDGSGADQRTLGVLFPRLVHAAPPKSEFVGDLVFFRATLRAEMATDITATPTPGSTAEIGVTPMIFFVG